MTEPVLGSTGWTRARTVVNWINLSTLLGLLVARIGGATVVRRGRGTWLASDYRYRFPVAGAFTVGNVIVSRHDAAWLRRRPALLRHEDRHCTQYAFFLGPVMLPLYVLAVAVSYLVSGDQATCNPFERWAGLVDGGYRRSHQRSD